jgi:hypothetical protein
MFSQLVTLYLTPVVFIYMDRIQNWLGHRKAVPHAEPVAVGK